MQQIILHLDMNSYFATVEQQANPLLRGKPVGVCVYLSDNSFIIAASVEAKKFGVKTGMRIIDAKKICPQIILLANDPEKYRFVSQKIFSLLKKFSHCIEIYSIDEAFINLTGLVEDFNQAVKLAKKIKENIKIFIGDYLTCSVGLSYTRWLAKFASNEHKPDGLTVISKNDLSDIFRSRPLEQAWGIGSSLANRLRLFGINNLYELQHSSPIFLKKILGWYGYYLWCHLNGIEIKKNVFSHKQLPKSVGHSYCLPKITTDKNYLIRIMFKLIWRSASRMRDLDMQTGKIICGYGYVDGQKIFHSRRLPRYLYDAVDIIKQCLIFFNKPIKQPVNFLAISLSDLIPNSGQLSFLASDNKKKNLNQAIDIINRKFGEFTLLPGSLINFREYAPDRIGFRKSVDI